MKVVKSQTLIQLQRSNFETLKLTWHERRAFAAAMTQNLAENLSEPAKENEQEVSPQEVEGLVPEPAASGSSINDAQGTEERANSTTKVDAVQATDEHMEMPVLSQEQGEQGAESASNGEAFVYFET